ncbi:hypothetical protein OFN54_24540, partial [Escherichia coli]|nr:hypothetical protein [Escherichia coli]
SWFCRPFTAKKPQKSGQDVHLSDRAHTTGQTPPGHGCAPTPRERLWPELAITPGHVVRCKKITR